jgi:RimJ/RimL family protein N-acetyltransferase
VRFPEEVPTLTDGVVTLRAHTPDDAPGSFEQCQDPLSQQWTTVPVPYSMADAEEFVGSIIPAGWREDRDWAFAVDAVDPSTTADDGAAPVRYAGTISLRPESAGRAEIAYGSHPWCRGRGVMERALRLLLAWGFDTQKVRTVVWRANKGNWASRKLAWRLGFSFDGTIRSFLPQRGELLDAWVGTLLAGEDRAPRSPWYDVPTLRGERVVLRAHRDEDAERIRQACTNPETRRWLSLPDPYTLHSALDYLEMRREAHATGRGLSWAVADPRSDQLLASVALHDLKPGEDAEVGYWTHPAARGRGVMTEAVGLVLRHAFVDQEDGGLGLARLQVLHAPGNEGSRRVIVRNGFVETGRPRRDHRIGDGSLADSVAYDLLREEWLARRCSSTDASSTSNPPADSPAPTQLGAV